MKNWMYFSLWRTVLFVDMTNTMCHQSQTNYKFNTRSVIKNIAGINYAQTTYVYILQDAPYFKICPRK